MPSTPRLDLPSRGLRAGVGAGIGLLVGLLLALLRGGSTAEGLELELVDLRTRLFVGQRGPDPRIVLVEVQEEDVEAVKRMLGRPWPWPLSLNASCFRLLAAAGVRAAVVDVFHLDRGAGPDDAPHAEDLGPGERQRLELEAATAAEYGDALREVDRVAMAFELATDPEYEVPARVRVAEGRLGAVARDALGAGLARPGANLPVRRAAEGARVLGFANVAEDADGVVRRAPVAGRWGERRVLSLALAAAHLVEEGPLALEERGVRIGGRRQPLMEDGSFLVSFRGPAGSTYPRVAPLQLLAWADHLEVEGEVPPAAREALEGRIVVWGVNIAGLQDLVTAPTSGALHGPEYQATALDNLLHGDGRVRATREVDAFVLLSLTLGLGALHGLLRGRFLPNALPFLVAGGFVLLAVLLFRAGTSVDLLTPVAGIVLTSGGVRTFDLLTEGRRNRWLEGTFGRYLAPPIIEALKRDPALLALGGRRREITILFSDVAGFTRLCEALTPEQVVLLLNRYLTMHAAAVMAEEGVVDKFEGDAVMAFFGDPVPVADHAERACRTALAVLAALPGLEPVWREMGLDDFQIRIGLNSGRAVVGNMGSEQRFDYTCMGDAVNLASRLEGANKEFGSRILLGPGTYEAVRDRVVARPLADLVVVGRERPVRVHELLALRDGAPPEAVDLARAFAGAREALVRGDLDAAQRALDEAERVRPGDGPTRWMRGLCARLRSGEEPSPWSGVVRQARK